MFSVNGTEITISKGDTGAMKVKATAKRRDTGATYIFGPRDRALFSIKGSNGAVLKEKIYEIINAIMTVTPVERIAPAVPITAQIDKSAFNAATEDSTGTVTFTYTTDWDTDPEDYGITVTGTPVSGDVIEVVYKTNEFIVTFMNADTDSLVAGGYSWDVRYVINPYYSDETKSKIVDGDQVITPNQPMGLQLLTIVGEI